MKFPNRIETLRREIGFSRDKLAQIASITRQALGLIEAGKVSPSTLVALRIARALGATVEDLFLDPQSESLATIVSVKERSAMSPGSSAQPEAPIRAFLGAVDGTLLARPARESSIANLTRPVHAVVSPIDETKALGRITWSQTGQDVAGTVFISGCDAGLGLLAEYLPKLTRNADGIWFEVPNRMALDELERGHTHIAAIHQVNRADGLKKSVRLAGIEASSDAFLVLTFAEAEIGWMLRTGDRVGFAGAESLGGGRLRVVNRPSGAGVRSVFDKLLEQSEIQPAKVEGYNIEVRGHLAVAEAVAEGLADVGLGHAGAAALFGLDFIPVQRETCSLVIPKRHLEHRGVQALLQTLQSDRFRGELHRFGPYDVTHTGDEG